MRSDGREPTPWASSTCVLVLHWHHHKCRRLDRSRYRRRDHCCYLKFQPQQVKTVTWIATCLEGSEFALLISGGYRNRRESIRLPAHFLDRATMVTWILTSRPKKSFPNQTLLCGVPSRPGVLGMWLHPAPAAADGIFPQSESWRIQGLVELGRDFAVNPTFGGTPGCPGARLTQLRLV